MPWDKDAQRHYFWWRSQEAHDLYWGAWDEPLSHGLFTPEGLPMGRRPGGWYYAPQIDTVSHMGYLATLKGTGGLAEARRFATEWRAWRRAWGRSPQARRLHRQIKVGAEYPPQTDVYAPAPCIALLLKKPRSLQRPPFPGRGPHDSGARWQLLPRGR
jgi:hypothetical protein